MQNQTDQQETKQAPDDNRYEIKLKKVTELMKEVEIKAAPNENCDDFEMNSDCDDYDIDCVEEQTDDEFDVKTETCEEGAVKWDSSDEDSSSEEEEHKREICYKCYKMEKRRTHNSRSKCEISDKYFGLTRRSTIRTSTVDKFKLMTIFNRMISYYKSYSKINTGAAEYSKNSKGDVCNKSFSRYQSLIKNSKNCTDEKPLRLFSQFKARKGKKLYECEVCNKRMSTRRNLKLHSRIHTDNTFFKCEICNKPYLTKEPKMASVNS